MIRCSCPFQILLHKMSVICSSRYCFMIALICQGKCSDSVFLCKKQTKKQWNIQTAPFSLLYNTLLKVHPFKTYFSSAYLVETLFCTGTLEGHPLMLQTMALKTR